MRAGGNGVAIRLTLHAYTCSVKREARVQPMEAGAMPLRALPCYCATLRQAARAVTALYEETLSESGLHATQFTALQVLKASPSIATTELADTIGIDQTTATRTLALIRKAGLAVDSAGSDRRERRWSLTTKGEARLRELSPRWRLAQDLFEKRLGKAEAQALKRASHAAAARLGRS